MKNQVEFQLHFKDDETLVEHLVEFFRPIAVPHVRKKEEVAVKSWEAVVGIVLTIVGEWAATRYILDPLADRTKEWQQSISSVWKKSKSKRKFSILVKFEHTTDNLEIEINETSDQEVLRLVWQYVRRASQMRQKALEQDVQLDGIRILPDGTGNTLVIGYEGNRPTYTIDLENEALKKLESSASTDETKDPSLKLWKLNVLVLRLDYLKMLAESGYDVSTDEIIELEREIEAAKRELGA